MTAAEAQSELREALDAFNRDQELRREGFNAAPQHSSGMAPVSASWLFPKFKLVEDVKEVGS